MRRIARAVMLVAAAGLVSGPLRAAPTSEEKGLAEVLFRDARALIVAGRYADACPKLAESQRLDPALGTLLNLGICHVKEGKTASGWAELLEAAEIATREGATQRAEYARRQASAIESDVPRLDLVVETPTDDTVITIDGHIVGRPAWFAGLPVDPGEHLLEASAPTKRPWKTTIDVAPASHLEVRIPALETATDVKTPSPPPTTPAPVETAWKPSPLGFVVVGIGLAGVAVGTIFGLQTFSKVDRADANCPNDRCTRVGHAFEDEARTSGVISTIAFGAGAVALAAGGYIVIRARGPKTSGELRLAPSLGGVRFGASF